MSDFITQCLSCTIGISCLMIFGIGFVQFVFSVTKWPKIAMFWQGVMIASVATAVMAVPAQASTAEEYYQPVQRPALNVALRGDGE